MKNNEESEKLRYIDKHKQMGGYPLTGFNSSILGAGPEDLVEQACGLLREVASLKK